jgi:hypothetical protein
VYNITGGGLSEEAQRRVYKEKRAIAPEGDYVDSLYRSNVIIDDSSRRYSSATFVGPFGMRSR